MDQRIINNGYNPSTVNLFALCAQFAAAAPRHLGVNVPHIYEDTYICLATGHCPAQSGLPLYISLDPDGFTISVWDPEEFLDDWQESPPSFETSFGNFFADLNDYLNGDLNVDK